MTAEITTHSDNVPATITPMDLIMQASTAGASIEKMEQLFNLQLRWEENEAKKAYHKAVADFKAESITILKTKKVGYENKDGSFTGYSHATLGNAVQTVVPFLSKHGLSNSWDIIQQGGDISVVCRLTHCMGHSEKVTMTAQKDDSGKKNLIQQVASTVTYLERYTFLAVVGLATIDQDDDGKGSVKKEDNIPRVSERQWMDFTALVSEIKGERAEKYLKTFCTYHHINDIAELPAAKYDKAVTTLEQERAK